METPSKPSRSEELCSLEQATQNQKNVTSQFEASAPQRHTKPQRSEYSTIYKDKFCLQNSQLQIPEHIKFNQLHSHNHVSGLNLFSATSNFFLSFIFHRIGGLQELKYSGDSLPEEFVETEYYKDLNGLDMQHHTTGTGFIKMETNGDCDFHLGEVSDGCCKHTATNPATNEWIPCAESVLISSNKPNRSDIAG